MAWLAIFLFAAAGLGAYAWHKFRPNPLKKIPPHSEITNQKWTPVDLSDTAALELYVDAWLNAHAPYVFDCAAKGVTVKDCKEAK